MKVLVADDDADLRELIAFTLTQSGYLVVKAGDGPSAVGRFEEESDRARRGGGSGARARARRR